MRLTVSLALGLAFAIAAFTIAAGLAGSPLPGAAALLTAAGVGVLVWKRPIVPCDPLAAPKSVRVVSGIAAVAALVALARLAVFIVSPAAVAYSQFPSSLWEVRHSCLTAYFVAGQAIPTTPNVYDDALYSLPGGDPNALRRPRTLGPMNIDAYEYPPPFLLLPRALMLLTSDFFRIRMIWFGLNVAVLLVAAVMVARALPAAAGTRAVLFIPFVAGALGTVNTLQKGNVQMLVIAISMAAMVLFARGRSAAGGALLAYATVSKLYPGMLVVYLLLRRQWRAVAWTAAWSAVLLVLSVLDTGLAPYKAFLDHLPGLLGGEAFPAFRNPAATAINISVPGLAFKLKLFGVAGMSFAAARRIGWVYTLVVLAAVFLIARRKDTDVDAPATWLAILILATLRSPFLPQGYGVIPGLWLVTVLAAERPPTRRTLLLALVTWLALSVYVPMDWGVDPRVLAVINLVPQVVMAAIAVVALRPARAAVARVEEVPAA